MYLYFSKNFWSHVANSQHSHSFILVCFKHLNSTVFKLGSKRSSNNPAQLDSPSTAADDKIDKPFEVVTVFHFLWSDGLDFLHK